MREHDRLLALNEALVASLRQHGHGDVVDAVECAIDTPSPGNADRDAVHRLIDVFAGTWDAPVLRDAFLDDTPTAYFRPSPAHLRMVYVRDAITSLVRANIVPRVPYVLALVLAFRTECIAADRHCIVPVAYILSCGIVALVFEELTRQRNTSTLVSTMNEHGFNIMRFLPLHDAWPPSDVHVREAVRKNAYMFPEYKSTMPTGAIRVHYGLASSMNEEHDSDLSLYFRLSHGLLPRRSSRLSQPYGVMYMPPFTVSPSILAYLDDERPSYAFAFAPIVIALERHGRTPVADIYVSWAAFVSRDAELVGDLLRTGRFTSARVRAGIARPTRTYELFWGAHDVRKALRGAGPVASPAVLAHFYVLLGRQALDFDRFDTGVGDLVPFVAALSGTPAIVDVATAIDAMAGGHDEFFVNYASTAFVRAYARRLVVTPPSHGVTIRVLERLDDSYDARACAEDIVIATLVGAPVTVEEAAPHRAAVEALVCKRPEFARVLVVYGDVPPVLARLVEDAALRGMRDAPEAATELVKRRRLLYLNVASIRRNATVASVRKYNPKYLSIVRARSPITRCSLVEIAEETLRRTRRASVLQPLPPRCSDCSSRNKGTHRLCRVAIVTLSAHVVPWASENKCESRQRRVAAFAFRLPTLRQEACRW